MDDSWEPNQDYLHTLVSMGISHSIALQALFCTGNKSIDEAVDYVFNNQEELENSVEHSDSVVHGSFCADHRAALVADSETESVEEEEDLRYYKMVFVVNTSLKMGVGKIAAQVGHACLGLYRNILDVQREELEYWECIGEKKVVVKGNDEEHLLELMAKAKANGIPNYIVRDAGHTQISSHSVTVLSLFGLEERVNEITGKLNLL